MKKLSKLMMLGLCAFLFASCSNLSDVSELSSSLTSENDITSEIITSEVEDIPNSWSHEEQVLMRTYLHNEVLPFAKIEGATWNYDRDLEGLIYKKEGNATLDEYNKFLREFCVDGYIKYMDLGDTTTGDMEALIIKELPLFDTLNESINADAVFFKDEGMIFVNVYYDIDIKQWQPEKVAEELLRVHGVSNVTMPEPNFDFDWVAVQGVANPGEFSPKYVNIAFGVQDKEAANKYKNLLKEASWSFDKDLGALKDPSNTLFCDVTLESTNEFYRVKVTIYKVSDF